MDHHPISSPPPVVSTGRRWLRQPLSRGHWRRWQRILTGTYLLVAIPSIFIYLGFPSAPSIIGILALLYTPAFEKHPPGGSRFGWAALFFIALFLVMPEKITPYPAFCCAACLLLETFYRRVVATIPILLGLLYPITTYLLDRFSYPIRLQLISLAGRLTSLINRSFAGSTTPFYDRAIAIDHPGEGLHLLPISLLAALLLMNYYQSHKQRKLSAPAILLLLTAATVFCLIANLFRIICFAQLAITPADALHHWLGLVSLLAFIFLPLVRLCQWTVRRWGVPQLQDSNRPGRQRANLLGNIAVALAILVPAALYWVKIW